jgi:hydrogenase expression/formation protein HypE
VTAKSVRRKLDIRNGRVDMSHGSGGRAMADLIAGIFRDAFANDFLNQGNDQASLPIPVGGRMVMTTDGYVVSPLFFPGGDIGSLAVHGTINDVAMAGAKPLYLSASGKPSSMMKLAFRWPICNGLRDRWGRRRGRRGCRW